MSGFGTATYSDVKSPSLIAIVLILYKRNTNARLCSHVKSRNPLFIGIVHIFQGHNTLQHVFLVLYKLMILYVVLGINDL